jgi:hypothetical protein
MNMGRLDKCVAIAVDMMDSGRARIVHPFQLSTRYELVFAITPQIDAQLLALLVEMAAFESEFTSRIADVMLVAADRRDNDLALVLLHLLRECSGTRC